MVVSSKKINEQFKYWSFTLIGIESTCKKLYGAKLFTTLDVRSGYFNITVSENSRKYIAFTIDYEKCECIQASFGIHVAPSYLP